MQQRCGSPCLCCVCQAAGFCHWLECGTHAVNHKEMNARLAALCREFGIYCWINAGETRQHGTGWVDAVTIGRNGALFIENKTEDGRRTRAQISVSVLLTGAGLEYRLYRPEDYASGKVFGDLEAIT